MTNRSAPLAGLVAALGICSVLACVTGTAVTRGPAAVQAPPPAAPLVDLPNREGSLKFAVLGDFGTGSTQQYEMAAEMNRVQQRFPFDVVLLVGDNIYGSERPQEMRRKFETPYQPLLDRHVVFRASLGNHDSRQQRYYKPFNMDGNLYYTFKAPVQNVRFFALESTYMEREQVQWLEKSLAESNDDWKIVFMHHPPYSSADYHGSDVRLRRTVEPLFVKYNVSVVFAGHDHVYERIKPQQGIAYFVTGSGGQLRPGDLDSRTGLTARGFDRDLAFLVCEIEGDTLTFQAISRTGAVVDSGRITRRMPPGETPEAPPRDVESPAKPPSPK